MGRPTLDPEVGHVVDVVRMEQGALQNRPRQIVRVATIVVQLKMEETSLAVGLWR